MARFQSVMIGAVCAAAAMIGATGSAADAATVTLTPTADTYVSSQNANTNYGSNTTFATNMAGGSSNHRWVYLRFDLSSEDLVNNALSAIKLSLVNAGNTTSLTIAVYGLLDAYDTWTEAGLTYNNDPNQNGGAFDVSHAYGAAPLATFTASKTDGTIDVAFDVISGPALDYIAADSDKIVTFVLVSQYTGSSGYGIQWYSSNHADNKPTLTLTLEPVAIPEPASLGLLGLAAVGLLRAARRRG